MMPSLKQILSKVILIEMVGESFDVYIGELYFFGRTKSYEEAVNLKQQIIKEYANTITSDT
jgi:hypothetical protein